MFTAEQATISFLLIKLPYHGDSTAPGTVAMFHDVSLTTWRISHHCAQRIAEAVDQALQIPHHK